MRFLRFGSTPWLLNESKKCVDHDNSARFIFGIISLFFGAQLSLTQSVHRDFFGFKHHFRVVTFVENLYLPHAK